MYGQQVYKQTRMMTATPGDLVVMLYDGLLNFVSKAERAVRESRPIEAADAINRAVDIFTYLHSTLRSDKAPELAANLQRVYMTWSHLLVRYNLEGNHEGIAELHEQVEQLREAWAEARSRTNLGEMHHGA